MTSDRRGTRGPPWSKSGRRTCPLPARAAPCGGYRRGSDAPFGSGTTADSTGSGRRTIGATRAADRRSNPPVGGRARARCRSKHTAGHFAFQPLSSGETSLAFVVATSRPATVRRTRHASGAVWPSRPSDRLLVVVLRIVTPVGVAGPSDVVVVDERHQRVHELLRRLELVRLTPFD